MTEKIPTVAIIGRTNVGKSSLFNALVGKKVSIVENFPGVTRDRNYSLVSRFGFPFTLIDTGGMVGEDENPLHAAVRAQCEVAIQEADLILCVFDGIHGVHPLDAEVVDSVRRSGKKVIWVANKCEQPTTQAASAEFYSLGVEDLQFISAAHKHGIKDLVEAIRVALDAVVAPVPVALRTTLEDENTIKVALIGKPNVGKSSILNRIVGEDRVVTSDIPGTTRDSIDVLLTRDGQRYEFVDTAGLRKKGKVADESIEESGNIRTLRTLAKCDVAVLVLDATIEAITEQDTKIAGLVHERGRGLVIVVNKWDAVEKDHRTVHDFTEMVRGGLKFAQYAPILFVSALSGRRCPSILETVKEVFAGTKIRVQTSDLNRILGRAFSTKPPPVYHGEPIKLYFATQIGTTPPSFVLFVNHPKRLNFSYERYLKNVLRQHYPFPGLDVKIIFKKRTSKEDRKDSTKEENSLMDEGI
ncbi:MAG: ribosome biogenesis GTPase Der [Deltaproteobacteria bacterium]|nr:ribosome biogenesis GTPase Der [Deltaproteobacteria bacterium]